MRIKYDGKLWDVYLLDDGTLDTVISVQPVAGNFAAQETRYDCEFASQYRKNTGEMTIKGLRELGIGAIEDYCFEEEL